jgi:hypothetical protein
MKLRLALLAATLVSGCSDDPESGNKGPAEPSLVDRIMSDEASQVNGIVAPEEVARLGAKLGRIRPGLYETVTEKRSGPSAEPAKTAKTACITQAALDQAYAQSGQILAGCHYKSAVLTGKVLETRFYCESLGPRKLPTDVLTKGTVSSDNSVQEMTLQSSDGQVEFVTVTSRRLSDCL